MAIIAVANVCLIPDSFTGGGVSQVLQSWSARVVVSEGGRMSGVFPFQGDVRHPASHVYSIVQLQTQGTEGKTKDINRFA